MIDTLFNTLPLAATIWLAGLTFLLVITSVLVSRINPNEVDWEMSIRRENYAYASGIVLALWSVFGVPATFIFGGESVYASETGAWIIVAGTLTLVFAWATLTGYNGGIEEGSVWVPVIHVLLVAIPLMLLVFATGLIAVGIGFWIILLFALTVTVAGLFFGPLGLIPVAPMLILMIIALAQ